MDARLTSISQNINFTGGVIHVIDTVLTIPQTIAATAEAAGLSAAAGALTQTNLVDAVDNLMDVTVFVPNNAAFQAIGSAVGNLTMAQLSSILEYHGRFSLSLLYHISLYRPHTNIWQSSTALSLTAPTS